MAPSPLRCLGRTASFLQGSHPIDEHDDRRECGVGSRLPEKKPLPIRTHDVLVPAENADPLEAKAAWEQFNRSAGVKYPIRIHRHCHQLPIGADVEQLSPITAPLRVDASVG